MEEVKKTDVITKRSKLMKTEERKNKIYF